MLLSEGNPIVGDLSKKTRLGEVKVLFARHTPDAFVPFYHSKKWDILRGFGLLQV